MSQPSRTHLLALELSAPVASIAVQPLDRASPALESAFEGERGRALLTEVDALLQRAGVCKPRIAAIAVGTGPGSYTGLRIACTAARALGYALGVPAAGVCSFAAAALQAPPGEEVHLLLDAYRGEVYHAAYLREQDGVKERVAPRILKRAAASRVVPEQALLLGDPGLLECSPRVLSSQLLPRAPQVAQIFLQLGGLSARHDPPQPQYLRAAAAQRPQSGKTERR